MKYWKSSLLAVAFCGLALFGENLTTTAPLARPAVGVVSAEASSPAPAPRVAAPAPVPIPNVVPVGQIVQLGFTDLTAEVARKSHIGYYPRPAGMIFFPAVGLNGDVVVFISSPTAVKVLVWIDSPGEDGKVAHVETELTIGSPEPDPDPEPDPEPDPSPVAQKVQVIVVEETADSTPSYARIRNSHAIREWAENGGHRVYFIDQDSRYTGDGADHWKSWQDRARSKGVPFVFVTPINDGTTILSECHEPTTEQAFLELVKKYGGVGRPHKGAMR
jgi:hypothetical protein